MHWTDSIYEVGLDLHRAESPLFCIWCLRDGPFFSPFCGPVSVFQLKWRAPPRGQYFKSVTALNYRERNSSYSGNSFFLMVVRYRRNCNQGLQNNLTAVFTSVSDRSCVSDWACLALLCSRFCWRLINKNEHTGVFYLLDIQSTMVSYCSPNYDLYLQK